MSTRQIPRWGNLAWYASAATTIAAFVALAHTHKLDFQQTLGYLYLNLGTIMLLLIVEALAIYGLIKIASWWRGSDTASK